MEEKLILDPGAGHITDRLRDNGYKGYAVGGCVRDLLLGEPPKDWDIATGAEPDEVRRVFGGVSVIPTGEKYGTVTVMLNKTPYEVTSFRRDGDYTDGRRPDRVYFSRSLKEDLSRRDFTINAMAYNEKEGLIDFFGGKNDLENGIIRCVGDPGERFREDALRTLRAIRFAMRYGFKIEENTKNSVMKNISRLSLISAERIAAEFSQALIYLSDENSDYFSIAAVEAVPELIPCIGRKQNNKYHIYDVYDHIIKATASIRPELHLRLAMLLHDIGKPECATVGDDGADHFYGHQEVSERIAGTVLKRLKFDNVTMKKVLTLIKYHDVFVPPDKRGVKKFLNKLGEEAFLDLLEVKKADGAAQSPEHGMRIREADELERIFSVVKSESECFSISDLAINGKDLIAAGYREGETIGKILRACLDKVIETPEMNSKEILLGFVADNIKVNQ